MNINGNSNFSFAIILLNNDLYNKMLIVFSRLLIICFLLISACSSKKTEDSDFSNEIYFLSQHSVVQKPNLNEYIDKLNQAILKTFRREKLNCLPNTKVLIVDDQRLIASTISSEKILVSSALIYEIQNESELAFILAHENAHIALCHLNSEKDPKEKELAADAYALKILNLLPYDPYAAVTSMNRLYKDETRFAFSNSHPNFNDRLENLVKLNIRKSSRYNLPNRAFRKFQMLLLLSLKN